MIENGTLLQNRYLIEKKIGTGGMGAVYLAIDKRFDNPVALKETLYKDDEFAEAFEREARLLNALQHPVLPHVSDYFAENDGYFLVMQYIEGEDLSDVLKREGAFPVSEVLRWTDQLLDALDYLHSQEPPVIHRDIKPHNLKLNLRGGILLLDFGLAKLNRQDASEVSVFGYSRTYSPLEQIQGTGTDARSDIFALGATAYHLLTGTPPVNALMRAAAIVGGNSDPLRMADELRPEIPESLASVINEALALDSKNRFISAKAMRQALEHAAKDDEAKINDPEKATVATAAAARSFEAAQSENLPAFEATGDAKNPSEGKLPPMVEKLPDKTRENVENIRPTNVSPASSIIVDVPATASDEKEVNQKRFVWAAAVLLFFGIATAFYFSSRENTADQTNLPVVNANSRPANSTSESVAETRKKTGEKYKSEESKTDTETGKVSDSSESPAKLKKQSSESGETVTDEENPAEPEGDSEEPIEETETEPTVRPRRTEKPIPDEMTEQEFEQIKREERRKRRQQRRNQADPYEN